MRRAIIAVLVFSLLCGCSAEPAPVSTPPTAPTTPAVLTAPPAPAQTESLPAVTDEQPVATWDGSADLSLWKGGSDYLLEAQGNILHVQANKVTPNAYFEAVFPAIDVRRAPYASLSALSDISANITVGLVDAAGKEGWLLGNAADREMAHGTNPMVHSFDFTKANIDLAQVTGMRIAFNRGAPGCSAKVSLSEIRLGGKAIRGLGYAPLPDVQMTIGDSPLPVTLYPVTKADAGASWSAEYPAEIVQTGSFQGDQFVYTLTGKPGNGTIVLTGEKDGKAARLAFNLSVAENQPPSLDAIPGQVLAVGHAAELRLSGLDDGDPASAQAIHLAAESQNPDVAAVAGMEYDNLSRWAILHLQGASAGKTSVTITLTDDRGASTSTSFDVAVYPEINQAPTFQLPTALSLAPGSELRQEISAVSGGEAGDAVTLSAQSDSTGVSARVENHSLVLQAAADAAGSATVTVTATDNGGNERNQGNASTSRAMQVTLVQSAITGLTGSFDGPQVDPALAGSGEGAHTLSIEEGALRVDIDKYATNNKWAGLWYALPAELDISANPVITLRMKADKETSMLIFLWDANNVYNTAGTVTVSVGTEWKEYTLDFTGKNLDADGKTVDFSRIKSLLFNFAPGLLDKGTFWLDDMKIGSDSPVKAAPPAVVIKAPLQINLLPGGTFEGLFAVSGMLEGDKAELSGAGPDFFSSASLTPEKNQLRLRLKTAPTATGYTRLKMSITGAENRKTEKTLDVIFAQPEQTAQVTVDREDRYQTMDGFGAFLGSEVWDPQKQDLALPFVQDLGITMARFGIIGNDFEHQNDNANPYVTDYSAFDRSALPLEWMKRLKAETGIDKYILTVWSPPAWMKKSRSLAASDFSGDNFLEERYYEEYAEFLVAVVRIVKEQTGIDLYAISVQNEPQFNEPYPSSLLGSETMPQVLKVVSERFKAEQLQTKIYMPEALPQQQGIQEYIRQLDQVPEASQGTDIIAIHNYDPDGIHVGGAGANDWADLAKWANASRPRQVWMTETSGHPDNWTGAKTLFGNIYNALVYGNASAWVWWTLSETAKNAQFGLVVDNQATSRYAVSRHFYRAVQQGAVRVGTTPADGILSVAFENPDGTLAVVLYNTGKTRLVSCTGVGALVDAWVSQDGLLSQPAQQKGESILLPADGVATMIFK
jgi:O-glycosyl hydrolase